MVHVCAVSDCTSTQLFNSKQKLPLFKFPNEEKNPELHKKWVKFINKNRIEREIKGGKNKEWKPLKTTMVCSDHFLYTDFMGGKDKWDKYIKGGKQRMRLTTTAVPSLKSTDRGGPGTSAQAAAFSNVDYQGVQPNHHGGPGTSTRSSKGLQHADQRSQEIGDCCDIACILFVVFYVYI